MTRILIIGHQGLVGRAIRTTAQTNFHIEGIGPADTAHQSARADLDLVVNAGGRIWGSTEVVEHALMSSAEIALLHARRSRCPILHIGSSAEYGIRTERSLLDETAPLHPRTAYAKAKIRSWNRIISEADHGAVSLRSGLILSRSVSSLSLLGKIRNLALKKNQVFPVPASVLAIERNPIHLDDFTSAVWAVVEKILDSSAPNVPQILNCGGDDSITIHELANQILSMSSLPYRYPKPQQIDQYELVTTNLLKNCTHWKPTYSIRKGDWLK